MSYQPNGFIPGGCALLALALLLFAAVTVKLFDMSANAEKKRELERIAANANRQTPPFDSARPASNSYDSNSPYNSDRSGTMNSNMRPILMNSNNDSRMMNSNMSDDGMRSNRGDLMMNSNMKNDPKPASEYDYRVKEETELRKEPSESGESIETLYKGDGLIKNYRKREDSKWYYVTAESGQVGWIDGNYIEEKSAADQ